MYSWGHPVSTELVDLLKKMFRPDPHDRITLAEIVTHPWINIKEQ
jgi:serine/threonine protein kinase